MNYRLNFALMLLVFSVLTYNVCMAYQDLQDVNVQGKLQQIGMLEEADAQASLIPPRKPLQDNQLAAIY
jgi:hypothetical protein